MSDTLLDWCVAHHAAHLARRAAVSEAAQPEAPPVQPDPPRPDEPCPDEIAANAATAAILLAFTAPGAANA